MRPPAVRVFPVKGPADEVQVCLLQYIVNEFATHPGRYIFPPTSPLS